MSTKTEDIIQEIKENAQRDRERLEELCEQVINVTNAASGGDPLAAVALVEHVVNISDALAKTTSQLVEVAKICVKRDLETDTKKNKNQDREDLFDELEEAKTKVEDFQ